MQPIFPGHSVFFVCNLNAKGLKPIHRKLGHRCGKWFIDPRTFEGLRRNGTATNDTASRTAVIPQLASTSLRKSAHMALRSAGPLPVEQWELTGLDLVNRFRSGDDQHVGTHLPG